MGQDTDVEFRSGAYHWLIVDGRKLEGSELSGSHCCKAMCGMQQGLGIEESCK